MTLGDSNTDGTFNTVDADQTLSNSLPTFRCYKDGSSIVAESPTTELARSTDAATAWQAALDEANNRYDANEKQQVTAVIDGSHLTYDISSQIVIKPGVKVQNAVFDQANAASGDEMQVGKVGLGYTQSAIGMENVTITNAPEQVRFIDLANCRLINLRFHDGAGPAFEGPILCTIRVNAFRANGRGIEFNNNGPTGYRGNSNWVYLRANDGDDDGIHNRSLRNTVFVGAVAEQNSGHGILTGGQGNYFIDANVENNGNNGIMVLDTNTMFSGLSGHANSQALLRLTSSAEQVTVEGPVRADNEINTSTDATDCVVGPNNNIQPAYLDSNIRQGKRIMVGGWGTNAGDPSSTGEWNGHGREGVSVWDTSNNDKYCYIAGSWRGPY